MSTVELIQVATPVNFFVAGEYYGATNDSQKHRMAFTFLLFLFGFIVAFFFIVGKVYDSVKELFTTIQVKFWWDWCFDRKKFKWEQRNLDRLKRLIYLHYQGNSLRDRMWRKTGKMILKYNDMKS